MDDVNRYKYKEKLSAIKGKTIAVVYIFENENAAGYDHYEIWKSDVICSWLAAIQELKCVPFILDARTFVSKAMNGTLPVIDYVINLNNGNYALSTLGLVPSVCSFLAIPCIPSETLPVVAGESKMISNRIAKATGLTVPDEAFRTNGVCIVRPNNLGSSIGVKIVADFTSQPQSNVIVQEFINGFDMTTPILYNPVQERMEVLPPVMYYPNSCDSNWFLGEEEKTLHNGYRKIGVKIDDETKSLYLELVSTFGIHTFCRIDSRVKCTDEEMNLFQTKAISKDRVFFLEINPLPTVKEGINFHTSLEQLQITEPMTECLDEYKCAIPNHTLTGFILSCSMMAIKDSKAKH